MTNHAATHQEKGSAEGDGDMAGSSGEGSLRWRVNPTELKRLFETELFY